MKKYIFLTSAITLCTLCPAFAESFPNDGYMLENKTYDNAAISDNMDDVYEGSVNAVAEYDNIIYNLTAGKYLPQSSTTITDCPAGSFCTGIGNVNYSENGAQGATSCSTIANGTYSQSATGASANTDCYRACSTTDIANSLTVSGNVYYDGTSGDGTSTCAPTSCVNGWHPKAGTPDLNSTIGQVAGENSAYVNYSGSFSEVNYDGQGSKGAAYYGLSTSDPMAFAVDYGNKGMIHGHGRCSTQQGDDNNYNWTNPTTFTSLTDETNPDTGGQYCYCQVDGYTPLNGTLQSLASAWVFDFDFGSASNCASACAIFCASNLRDTNSNVLAFRAAVFGSLGASAAMCEANTITINWSDTTAEAIAATGAGTAVYGGDVKTPQSATDKTSIGLRFKGWKFSKPTTVEP